MTCIVVSPACVRCLVGTNQQQIIVYPGTLVCSGEREVAERLLGGLARKNTHFTTSLGQTGQGILRESV